MSKRWSIVWRSLPPSSMGVLPPPSKLIIPIVTQSAILYRPIFSQTNFNHTNLTAWKHWTNSSLMMRFLRSMSPLKLRRLRRLLSVKNTDSDLRASNISWKPLKLFLTVSNMHLICGSDLSLFSAVAVLMFWPATSTM